MLLSLENGPLEPAKVEQLEAVSFNLWQLQLGQRVPFRLETCVLKSQVKCIKINAPAR